MIKDANISQFDKTNPTWVISDGRVTHIGVRKEGHHIKIFVLNRNNFFQENSNEGEVCKLAAILPGHDVFRVHVKGLRMLDTAVKYFCRSLTDVVTLISKYS